jgi:murein DD-endopeptidase MepM/ murein hydrolase activator NlpD
MPRRQFLGGLAATALTVVLLADRAAAYDVAISPEDPQLGDTISVIMAPRNAATSAPVVTVNGNTQYPAFPVVGGRFRALVPTSPLDPPGRLVIQISGSGEETRNLAVGLRNRSFPTQRITLSSGQSDLGTEYEFDRVAQFKTIVTPEKFWNGPLVRPSQGRVSTEYGVRRYYNGVFAEDYYHRGVDYAAGTGSPVVAPAAGHIALVGREAEGFELHGNTIGIDHGQGVLSIMIHLSRIDVNQGDFVQPGQTIGAVGSTGASTGPHLHWGLYVHGVAVDPVPWRYAGLE